jgi:hypothetical protein
VIDHYLDISFATQYASSAPAPAFSLPCVTDWEYFPKWTAVGQSRQEFWNPTNLLTRTFVRGNVKFEAIVLIYWEWQKQEVFHGGISSRLQKDVASVDRT